jgi:DinB family protein
MGERSVATLVSEVDRARRRLYALLRSSDARVLSKRTPSGKWSIIENVRHLVFAEQVHLFTFLPEGSAWNPMRLSKRGKALSVKGGDFVFRYKERQLMAEYAGKPKNELEGVLLSWDLIHQPVRKALKANGGDAEYALERHLGHLLRHIEVIEKQLARASEDS